MKRQTKREKALGKEAQAIEKLEKRLAQSAMQAKPAAWKRELENKIPPKVYTGLESAFCKGFSVVFTQGTVVIEKGFDKEEAKADHAIRDFALQRKGSRKEWKQLHQAARKSGLVNMAVTTAEGIGLGALGIGMPDIVLFLGTLLKGIYEMALHYGFDYESQQEQLFVLKMMAAALSTGQEWADRNREIEEWIASEGVGVCQEAVTQQMQETAAVFAMDMLLLKFIQGLPLVGILGGAANPVYYHKVLNYVQLKYRKRYLLRQGKQCQ